MVDDCECVALLVDDDHLEVGRELMGLCPSLRRLVYLGSEPEPTDAIAWDELLQGPSAPFPEFDEDTLAAIVYTGGTFGEAERSDAQPPQPDGQRQAVHDRLRPRPVRPLPPRGADVPCGRHLADVRDDLGSGHPRDPSRVPRRCGRRDGRTRADHPHAARSDDDRDARWITSRGRRATSRAYGCSCSASPMPKETRRAMRCSTATFTRCTGSTEAAPLVTQSTAEDHRRGGAGEEAYVSRLDSAGRDRRVQCEVRDPATGEPLPAGEPGEIWVRGPNVMLGYWKREEETRAVLTPDGWYRSGDMAYADEHGYLYIVDRLKDMIISGGENVYSTEVELALYERPMGGVRGVRRSRSTVGRARARRRRAADRRRARRGGADPARSGSDRSLQGPALDGDPRRDTAQVRCRQGSPKRSRSRS